MSTSEVPVQHKTSRWEDYVDVFFSPGELYARRANDSVAPAFWTLLLLSVIVYYAFLPANGAVIDASMEQARAQLAAQGQDPSALDGWVRTMTYLGGAMGAIVMTLSILFAAFLMWLIARMVGVRATFRHGLVIAVYAGFIYLLAQIAGSVMGMIVGDGLVNPTHDLSLGALRFVEPANPPGMKEALLRRTEIFFLWQAVVWAIGARVVMGASKAQSAIIAAGTWILFAVPGVIGALFRGAQPGA